MMAIKLNLREAERRSAYQNLVVDQTNAGVRVQNVGILQRAANGLVFGLENVIVIWLAALLVMDGKFTVGMLYAFIGFKLLFLARVFQTSYLIWPLVGGALAVLLAVEPQRLTTTTTALAE